MNFRYAHILYRGDDFLTPKRATFDHRTKTGFMTTWSIDHSAELLKYKYWNCLSAYGLESAMRRKISFERKHSDSNLLYFKYELEVPEALESYFDQTTLEIISKNLSIRETTEEVYKMLKEYQEGSLSFNDQRFSSWLAMKTGELQLGDSEKRELEKSLIKYVETIVGRVLWTVYNGDLPKMGKDLSSIVYMYTEMLDLIGSK
ncbi:MAG: hypothetical protein JW697_01855 [Kosmotogaceae bacterium]|nr:hypothetical protein [Kosmotogaceae bacterium]